jgi:hypothetical protein
LTNNEIDDIRAVLSGDLVGISHGDLDGPQPPELHLIDISLGADNPIESVVASAFRGDFDLEGDWLVWKGTQDREVLLKESSTEPFRVLRRLVQLSPTSLA